jgi:anthraniloyl-CoA monooxygenase
MGDAAHTTPFTIGSGSKLAIEDAIGLANKLHEHKDLQAALKAYEEERRPPTHVAGLGAQQCPVV